MAIIVPIWAGVPDASARDGYSITWGPMANGDIGKAVLETENIVGMADRSVQVEGTFGASGTVAVKGSNDSVNFRLLNDPSSTPLNVTVAEIKGVLEAVKQIRPEVTNGDGTTSLTVTLFVRKLR